MSLKFPNVRLSVFNRLLRGGKGSCVQAMVEEAYELGLISSGSLADLEIAGLPLETGTCGSNFAARRILERFCHEYCLKHASQGNGLILERLWSGICSDLEIYKSSTNQCHNHKEGHVPAPAECSQMAPVLMDIMLQHLSPYV